MQLLGIRKGRCIGCGGSGGSWRRQHGCCGGCRGQSSGCCHAWAGDQEGPVHRMRWQWGKLEETAWLLWEVQRAVIRMLPCSCWGSGRAGA
jgi:hypothetical protein